AHDVRGQPDDPGFAAARCRDAIVRPADPAAAALCTTERMAAAGDGGGKMTILRTACAAAMLFAAPVYAFQPTRPVEVVVHTGPKGGSDLLARAVATMIEKEKLLPVRMQVVNKPGGGSAVAAAYLAEKAGEQHTIGFFTGVWLTSPLTSAEAKVTLRDLTPIARLVLEPALIAVKADAPYKGLGDFIAAAKQHPGQLKQSGGSVTSRDNVVRQLLQKATGARWAFISFPGGGERIAALLGGHVNMMVIEPAEAGEHIRAGNMRVLAQVS